MNNGVLLTSGELSSLYAATDLYSYDREAELEPVYVMGLEVNNITLVGCPEIILECISDVHNVNGEVVSSIDGNN